jgi:hypothetical protein
MENQIIIKKEKKENNEGNIDEALIETNKRKMVQSIIQSWLKLQKTIKEEMTLEDVIIRHQDNEFVQLKNYFKEYYKIKLESRKILEELNELDLDENNEKKPIEKELIIDKTLQEEFLDLYQPIYNLLFLFRENYDYIITLISLMSFENNEDDEKNSSLIEFFCNQFYENIIIPNPEQEELLLLICKLLEMEILPMNAAYSEDFLDENTFLGKFINSFIKRQEIKIFLSSLINPLLLDIDNNSNDNYLGLSLFAIEDYINEKKNKENKNRKNDDKYFNNFINFNSRKDLEDFLFNDITKSSIVFKSNKKENAIINNMSEKQETDEEESNEKSDEESEEENDEEIIENLNKNMKNDKEEGNDNLNNEINIKYKEMLDVDFLEKEINNEKNEQIKN